jgi:hypothetical protein
VIHSVREFFKIALILFPLTGSKFFQLEFIDLVQNKPIPSLVVHHQRLANTIQKKELLGFSSNPAIFLPESDHESKHLFLPEKQLLPMSQTIVQRMFFIIGMEQTQGNVVISCA